MESTDDHHADHSSFPTGDASWNPALRRNSNSDLPPSPEHSTAEVAPETLSAHFFTTSSIKRPYSGDGASEHGEWLPSWDNSAPPASGYAARERSSSPLRDQADNAPLQGTPSRVGASENALESPGDELRNRSASYEVVNTADESEQVVDRGERSLEGFHAQKEEADSTTRYPTESRPPDRAELPDAWAQDISIDYEHQSTHTFMEDAVDESPAQSLLARPEESNVTAAMADSTDDWDRVVGATIEGGYSSVMDPEILQEVQNVEGSHEELPQHYEATFETVQEESAIALDFNHQGDGMEADPFRPLNVEDAGGSVFTTDTESPFRKVIHQPSGSEEDRDSSMPITPLQANDGSNLTDESFPDAPPLDSTEATTTPKRDDDLAALWSAALGEDEFLEDTNALDPSHFFMDDGEGFLNNEASVSTPQQYLDSTSTAAAYSRVESKGIVSSLASGQSIQDRYSPLPVVAQNRARTNPYAPAGLQFIQESQNTRTLTSPLYSTVQNQPYLRGAPSFQQPKRPVLPTKTESFADKAKGGYSSPYDLPMEISKPRERKRVGTQPFATGKGNNRQLSPPPPPRSSSMPSKEMPGPLHRHAPPADQYTATPSAPSSQLAMKSPPAMGHSTAAGVTSPSRTEKQNSNNFFAELPTITKPKTPGFGRYTPQPGGPAPFPPPPLHNQSFQLAPQHASTQFQQPDRLSLFPTSTNASADVTLPQGFPQPQPSASVNARYSPAPVTALPPAGPRYSPAVPIQPSTSTSSGRYAAAPPPTPPTSQPHTAVPRTSSPLAVHARAQQRSSQDPVLHRPGSQPFEEQIGRMGDESVNGIIGSATSQAGVQQSSARKASLRTPPPSRGILPSAASPPKRMMSNYLPQRADETSSLERKYDGPKRPQTQSPGSIRKVAPLHMPAIERPASVHGPTSPILGSVPQASVPRASNNSIAAVNFDFIEPTDDRVADPLQRWKGQPIFTWSLGGTAISSFPKQIPRYTMGQTRPMIKCSPGEVRIRSIRDILPLEERYAQFPGPLRSKGKKKEVIGWLTRRTEELEGALERTPLEMRLQAQENCLFWKVMRVLVEHDGVLEGNASVDKATRQLLCLDATTPSEALSASLSNGLGLNGVYLPASSPQAESVNPSAIDEIRRMLLLGHREEAIWHAADNRLWAHAMLISSTLGSEIWTKLVHEFVRQEVRKFGNSQPLAALYEVFAGNGEDSIDHLVPPSARAGHRMVSVAGSIDPSGNALAGLDRWRETLGLVVSNRSAGDVQALAAMGKLLASYGRMEAAHICFLFARGAAQFGGVDDPKSNFTLLGTDQPRQSSNSALDMDAVLLSEVYEFALSLSNQTTFIPHLQAYKLQYALKLAECGYRNEAQQYCEAIAAAMKSTTKLSPYYNSSLVGALDDLTKRLSQSPKDTSSSWFSRPSAGKVSGLLGARFNKFIAGDDSDDGSNSSAKGADDAPGLFARIPSGTPTISRSASSTDLYSLSSQSALPHASTTNSRYAPSSGYAPHSVHDQQQLQPALPIRSRYDPQATSSLPLRRPSIESTRSVPVVSRLSDSFQRAPRVPPRHHSSYDPIPQPASFQSSIAEEPLPYMAQSQHSEGMSDHGPHAAVAALRELRGRRRSDLSAAQADDQATPTIDEEGDFVNIEEPHHSNNLEEDVQHEEIISHMQRHLQSFDQPSPAEQASSFGYERPTASYAPATFDRESSVSNYPPPPDGGYLPPHSSYEPPSYVPYEPDTPADDGESPVSAKKAKKSFLDDEDDDLSKKAAALKKQEKASKDKAADEAFRKAAEADAARDKGAAGDKKGWFGGWFGGKKDPNAGPGPIKAKLGEENSFYYDPELKKWVNKKGGAETETPTATPPPPKAGPPRSAPSSVAGSRPPTAQGTVAPVTSLLGSAAPAVRPPSSLGLPSGPPSRMGTPAVNNAAGAPAEDTARTSSAPPIGGATPPSGLAPPSALPSRPSTSMSNASDIDDLLGAAQPRKGGTLKKGKKGSRYVDVMAK